MKVIVDLLGSDNGPECIFRGVLESIKLFDCDFIVVGPKKIFENFEIDENYGNRIEYIYTDEFINNNEEPTFAVRRKKKSSILLAMKELKEHNADGLISFGSTGAVLVCGLLIVQRISNVERAALTSILPADNGKFILLDLGANIECTPKILCQFASMGNIYAKEILNKKRPKVALLNIGSEVNKGTKILKETYAKMDNMNINFYGNIEARDIFDGKADVVICDGFYGNLVLKSIEGTVGFIFKNLKKSLMSSLISKFGTLLIKKSLINLKNNLDYKEFGACPMLGLKEVVFKGHGSSDEKAVVAGISSLIDYINMDINSKIKKEMVLEDL